MRMNEITRNAQDQAVAYAWLQLQHTPYDGGRTQIEFESLDRFEFRRDENGDPLRDPRFPDRPLGEEVSDGWIGHRKASTEEGYSNLSARVRPYEDGVWVVEIGTDSRDCDGQYCGGWDVTFEEGKVPVYNNLEQRDLAAEAAGY